MRDPEADPIWGPIFCPCVGPPIRPSVRLFVGLYTVSNIPVKNGILIMLFIQPAFPLGSVTVPLSPE